jgi:hypothetical protein
MLFLVNCISEVIQFIVKAVFVWFSSFIVFHHFNEFNEYENLRKIFKQEHLTNL